MKKMLFVIVVSLSLSGCVDFYMQHKLEGFDELGEGDTIQFLIKQSSSEDRLKLYSRDKDGKTVSFNELKKDLGMVLTIKDRRGEIVYSNLVEAKRNPRICVPGKYTIEIIVSSKILEFLRSRENYLELRRSYFRELPQPSVKVWKRGLKGIIKRRDFNEY
jgi:hypothetical protein